MNSQLAKCGLAFYEKPLASIGHRKTLYKFKNLTFAKYNYGLVPYDSMAVSAQSLLPLLLRLSHPRITSFNVNNRGFAFFVPEEIPILNHEIAASPQLHTIVASHRLLKCKAVFGDFALCAFTSLWEPAVGVAESEGFLVGRICFGHDRSSCVLHVCRL